MVKSSGVPWVSGACGQKWNWRPFWFFSKNILNGNPKQIMVIFKVKSKKRSSVHFYSLTKLYIHISWSVLNFSMISDKYEPNGWYIIFKIRLILAPGELAPLAPFRHTTGKECGDHLPPYLALKSALHSNTLKEKRQATCMTSNVGNCSWIYCKFIEFNSLHHTMVIMVFYHKTVQREHMINVKHSILVNKD